MVLLFWMGGHRGSSQHAAIRLREWLARIGSGKMKSIDHAGDFCRWRAGLSSSLLFLNGALTQHLRLRGLQVCKLSLLVEQDVAHNF